MIPYSFTQGENKKHVGFMFILCWLYACFSHTIFFTPIKRMDTQGIHKDRVYVGFTYRIKITLYLKYV